MVEEVKLPTYETLLTEAIRSLTVDSGIVSSPASAGGNSLSDTTKAWAINVHKNRLIKIIRGQGVGQIAVIDGNASNSLVIKGTWPQAIGVGAVYLILEKDTAQILRDVLNAGFDVSAAHPLETHDPTIEDVEGKVETDQYYDRVFYDSVNGIAGTAWPVGTPQVPSDVIADIITICAVRKLKVIDVFGALTLTAAMEGYTFIGHRHENVADTLNLNGQDVDNSLIMRCVLTGAQGGTGFLTLEDCLIYAMTNFQGIANLCDLYGSAMSLLDGGYADLSKCNSVHGVLTITVNGPARASFKECSGNMTLTAQDDGLLFVRGYKGTLIIDTMTGGTAYIYCNGADLTINATCTGGTINIYGDARVTDNHGVGCTVNNYTLQAGGAIALTTFGTEIGGAVAYVAASWETIFTNTVTKPTKLAGIIITNSAAPANPIYRICSPAGTKIFPFGASEAVNTGVLQLFDPLIELPKGATYTVEVNCTGIGGTATMTELDKVEVG